MEFDSDSSIYGRLKTEIMAIIIRLSDTEQDNIPSIDKNKLIGMRVLTFNTQSIRKIKIFAMELLLLIITEG